MSGGSANRSGKVHPVIRRERNKKVIVNFIMLISGFDFEPDSPPHLDRESLGREQMAIERQSGSLGILVRETEE